MTFKQIIMHELQCPHDIDGLVLFCFDLGLYLIPNAIFNMDGFWSPAALKAWDGRYWNLSVRLSVTLSFRTLTQKRIAVFSQNFAGMCTMVMGVCCIVFDIDGMF